MPLIQTIHLARIYRSGTADLAVFVDLDLEVEQGERLAIVGESGAGKSTLLYLLGALDRPSTGAIYFDTRNLLELTEAQLAEFRNREVGFVWQIHNLLPEFTALENVMMPLLISGRGHREAELEAAGWLAEVGLGDRASHRSGELSGGEQQRVALARALVRGRGHREAELEAAGWLAEVGLGDRASHRSGELSGGEQQRVALARALV